MSSRPLMFAVALLAIPAAALTAVHQGKMPSGWQLPPDADELLSPLKTDEKVLAAGNALYTQTCERCHGPAGRGDGPDADPENRTEMDLTNARRAGRNPDGIVFHKILSGRGRPEMPAFKDELSTDEIWRVVAYIQTLRRQP
ncbi:MAG: c-type cytochrome [Acidobacteria bacterium]|nr:c-type cytochrome [Acidobacteriota bacterium]